MKRSHSYHTLLYSLILLLLIVFSSCKKIDLFEKTAVIPKQEWSYDLKPTFSFTIEDTTRPYKAYIIVRHTDAYQYQNLYLNLTVKYPGNDTAVTEKVNVQLADNSRGWYGSGMDDIWESRFPLNKTGIRLRKGEYKFTLDQIMRDNPLQHIMNVGIRIEKAE